MQQRHLYQLEIGDTFRFVGEAGVNTLVTDTDDIGCVGYTTKEGWYYEAAASGIVMDSGVFIKSVRYDR